MTDEHGQQTSDIETDYISLLETWRRDGTLARLDDARVKRTPVRIRRSSGAFETGIIGGYGHAGLSMVVCWGYNLGSVVWDVGGDRVHWGEGVSGKRVATADLLDWNPALRGSHVEAIEQ